MEKVFKNLELNRIAEMWVVNLTEYRKEFTSGGTKFFVHDITLKDDDEFYYQTEYVSRSPKLDHFAIGEKAKFRVEKARNSGHRCDEILPYKATVVGTINPAGTPPLAQAGNNSMVAGHSYSQALTLATQIKCAGLTSTAEPFTTEDLLSLANELDIWLMNKKAEHSF